MHVRRTHTQEPVFYTIYLKGKFYYLTSPVYPRVMQFEPYYTQNYQNCVNICRGKHHGLNMVAINNNR